MIGGERVGSFFRINRWLIVSLVALGAAVYLSARYVQQLSVATPKSSISAPAVTTVLVARTPLTAYTVITAAALRPESVLSSDVPPGALTSMSQAVGKWTSVPIAQGLPVVSSDVFAPQSADVLASRIHPGDMAVDLPLGANQVVDGLIEPGDTISLFTTITEKGGQQATEDFLNQVKVLAVNGSMAPPSSSTAGQNLTLILALPPKEVSELLFMQQKGPVEAVLDAPNATTTPPPPFNTSQWQSPVR